MGESKNALPVKVDEKNSFIDLIRKALKKTTKYVDSEGKTGYITYPPKKGFTDKQIKNLRELEIHDTEILGNGNDTCLRDLRNLRTLILGEGTKAIASNVIPRSVETLIIPESLTDIPEGAIYDSNVKRLISPSFDISTKSSKRTNIFFDEFGRLNLSQDEYYSKGQVDYFNQRKNHALDNPNVLTPTQEASAARNRLTRELLESTGVANNSHSLYIYRKCLESESDFSVHAVLDTFPMPEEHRKDLDDNLLIGILVNGKEELDLKTLEQYPNLKNVFVGKDVKRVVGFDKEPEKINSYDINVPTKYKSKSPSGKNQVVVMMSDETTVMKSKDFSTPDRSQTRSLEKDNEIEFE